MTLAPLVPIEDLPPLLAREARLLGTVEARSGAQRGGLVGGRDGVDEREAAAGLGRGAVREVCDLLLKQGSL